LSVQRLDQLGRICPWPQCPASNDTSPSPSLQGLPVVRESAPMAIAAGRRASLLTKVLSERIFVRRFVALRHPEMPLNVRCCGADPFLVGTEFAVELLTPIAVGRASYYPPSAPWPSTAGSAESMLVLRNRVPRCEPDPTCEMNWIISAVCRAGVDRCAGQQTHSKIAD
jgi:hypothetical protein